ncbi:MAG: site-specific DNA-methyltransferase, partial [Gammaproteobacteria bacterium]
DVPYRLLEADPALSCGDADSGNLIVQGDNLHALKALLPRYAGQVKCIYIDPPYNTGNEGWVYNDNVNSPEIRRWLGEVVGKEGETLDRHDRWLCMMYPRLVLLRQFLRDDGVIFVSIDDNEVAHLRLLMDEVFGFQNFVATIAWQRRTSPDARLGLSQAHDHILVYARKKEVISFKPIKISPDEEKKYKNPDNDPRGPWVSSDFTAQGWRPNQMYEIRTPGGTEYSPPPGRCWGNIEEVFLRLVAEGRIWFGKSGKSRPRVKTYLSETSGKSAWTWWSNKECGHNQEAKKEIIEVLGHVIPFDTPKPTRLIQRILQIATDKDSLVLDSFAGSGSTGHAVLKQNAEDGGNRRFILVEMDENIAANVTAERVRRVIEG